MSLKNWWTGDVDVPSSSSFLLRPSSKSEDTIAKATDISGADIRMKLKRREDNEEGKISGLMSRVQGGEDNGAGAEHEGTGERREAVPGRPRLHTISHSRRTT